MDVDYLREALREDAQLAGEPEPNLHERVRAQRQRSDRRRLASLAAGLAAVLVAVAVPVGLSLLGGAEERVVASPSVPEADIFGAPTRGSLAGDARFLEAVTQLSWAVPGLEPDPGSGEALIPDPPVETRHVVFAGDVPSGRWALVVGPNTTKPTGEAADPDLQTDIGALSDIAAVWFVGPLGASPEQMQPGTMPRGISSDRPASLYDGASGALVVVAAPGDVIEVSPRPEVAADATVTRSYLDVSTSDAAAVVAIESNPYADAGMPAVQYRVTRAGAVVAEQTPDGYGSTEGTAVPYIELDYLRQPVVARPDQPTGREQQIGTEILGEYGLRPDQVNLQVHYVGPVPGTGESPAGLTVVTATFPSGAVLTRAFWLEQIVPSTGPAGSVFGGSGCANELSAVGVPGAARVLAIRCDVGAGTGDGQRPEIESTLVVLSPPGLAASSAVAEGSSGNATFDLGDDGIGMAAFPDGAQSVMIHAADGTVLDEVPIYTQ